MARYVVSAFRIETARAGAADEVTPLVTALCRLSPEFHTMWHENSVTEAPVDIVKHIDHPVLGSFAFEHSTFSVDGRPDLTLVVYNPATLADAEKLGEAVLSHRSVAGV